MIDGEYRTERKHKGKNIIIDIAKLPSYAYPEGIYEVLAFVHRSKTGKELAMVRTPDFGEAVRAYEKMLLDFPADKPEEQQK